MVTLKMKLEQRRTHKSGTGTNGHIGDVGVSFAQLGSRQMSARVRNGELLADALKINNKLITIEIEK